MPKITTYSKNKKSRTAKKRVFPSILKGRKKTYYAAVNSSYMAKYSNSISYLNSLEENEISLMIASSSKVAASLNS